MVLPMKALLLAAVALFGTPAFPPPKFVAPTPDLKCDWGPIASIKTDASEMIVGTEAGPLTVVIEPEVKLADAEGKPIRSATALRLGQKVRVYYVVETGAKAREIDVLP